MKHTIGYQCVQTDKDGRETALKTYHGDGIIFWQKSKAWSKLIREYDFAKWDAAKTRNAAIKRLKRKGWRVEKVAVVDAQYYRSLIQSRHDSLERGIRLAKHNIGMKKENQYLTDQLEGLEKENKILRDLDADRMAGWDAYMRLEKQMYRPKLAYMGLGAALASIGIIGADLLLKAFG